MDYRHISGREKNLFEDLMLALDFSIGRTKVVRRKHTWS